MSGQGEVDKLAEVAEVANVLAETDKTIVTLYDGKTKVEIYKCRARNTGTVLSAVHDVMTEMGIKTLGDLPKLNLKDPAIFMPLLAKASGDVYEIVAELSSLDYESTLDLELDDVIAVALQVVNVNKTFFLKRVMPLIQSVLPQNQVKKKAVRKRK